MRSSSFNSRRSFHGVPFLLAGSTRPQFACVGLMVVVVHGWTHLWESVCLLFCSCKYTSRNGSFRSASCQSFLFWLSCYAISMHGCSSQCLCLLAFPWQCSVFIDFLGGQPSFHVLHLCVLMISEECLLAYPFRLFGQHLPRSLLKGLHRPAPLLCVHHGNMGPRTT